MVKTWRTFHDDPEWMDEDEGGYLVFTCDYKELKKLTDQMLEDMQGEGMHTKDIEEKLKEMELNK